MKRFICLLTLCSCCLFGEKITIQSSTVSMKDHLIRLDGAVQITHPFGILYSKSALVTQTEKDKLKKIEFEKDVLLKLNEQSSLSCDFASIDFEHLIGFLKSGNQHIVYKDIIHTDDGKSPIELSCKDVEFKILKEIDDIYQIHHLNAFHDVHLTLPNHFDLYSDKAFYQRLNDPSSDALPSGIIQLFPKLHEKCILIQQDNRINSDKITVNTKFKEIIMEKADGKIRDNESNKLLNFHTDTLIWSQLANLFIFTSNNKMEDEDLGVILSDGKMEVDYERHMDKSYIREIRSFGPTTIQLKNEGKEEESLSCFGFSKLNKTLQSFIASKPTSSFLMDKQNVYRKGPLTIYADSIHMDYYFQDQRLHPSLIECKGNIKIYLKKDNYPFDTAICDIISYYPEKDILILSAKEQEKVLFLKENGKMEMSADSIIISNKEQIKGVGKVKFAFDHEQKKLFKHFFSSPPH
ncbi:MAG: hypothetical protein HY860_06145 [Chlamydiales bacterium]|nr:hypothetical protein [Chlamydiales bacterium]